MRHITFLTCCLSSLLIASNANAQLQEEVQVGLSTTLSLGGVPQELGMSDDDQFALADVWMMAQIELQNAFQKYNSEFSENLPEEMQQELKSELEKKIRKVRDEELSRLTAVLDDDQLTRLKQIRFQYLRRKTGGLTSIKNDLGLSEKQIHQIEKIGLETKNKALDVRNEARELQIPAADVQDLLSQIKKNSEKRLWKVLTANQRGKLTQLQGKEFKFQFGPSELQGATKSGDASEGGK